MLEREIKLVKENKKAAIVCMGTRISLNSKNVRSVDLIYLRNILQDVYGRTVDYLTLKTKKEADLDYFKNVADENINDYDEIYIYNASLNPFGGIFKTESIITFQKLFDFTGDIWYFLCDPKMPCTDMAQYIKSRLVNNRVKTDNEAGYIEITPEFCDEWSSKVYPKIKIASAGCNYNMYYETYTNKLTKNSTKKPANTKNVLNPNYEWAFLPLFEYYAIQEDLNAKLKDYPFEDRKYDLIYFGNNRQTERNKIIEKFYNREDYNYNYVLGFDPDWSTVNYSCGPYVKHDEMFELIPKSAKATLVLGDTLHNNNTRTPRFFEAMLLDIVAFIYIDYDKDKRFLTNEFLKDFCYVSTPEELVEKYNKIKNDEELFRKIVKLQREDIISQFKKYFD